MEKSIPKKPSWTKKKIKKNRIYVYTYIYVRNRNHVRVLVFWDTFWVNTHLQKKMRSTIYTPSKNLCWCLTTTGDLASLSSPLSSSSSLPRTSSCDEKPTQCRHLKVSYTTRFEKKHISLHYQRLIALASKEQIPGKKLKCENFKKKKGCKSPAHYQE